MSKNRTNGSKARWRGETNLKAMVKELNSTISTRFELLSVKEMSQMVEATEAAVAEGTFKQRPSKDRIVDKYTRDISNGDWSPNPQPVIVTQAGLLLDGLHRFKAAIKAQMDMVFNITWGWPDDQEFKVIDTGTGRSVSQLMALTGTRYSSLRVAVARCIGLIGVSEVEKSRAMSYDEIERLTHIVSRDLEALLVQWHESGTTTGTPSAGVVAAMAWCRNVETQRVDEFAKCYFHSIFTEGHPARALKRWMEGNSEARKSRRTMTITRVSLNAIRAFLEKRNIGWVGDLGQPIAWARSLNPRATRECQGIFGLKAEIPDLKDFLAAEQGEEVTEQKRTPVTAPGRKHELSARL
jgi:hypothetical protein